MSSFQYSLILLNIWTVGFILDSGMSDWLRFGMGVWIGVATYYWLFK